MNYKENYFYVEPDVRLHYIDEGEGKPLFFVTGFSGSAEGFSYQIEHFKKKYRVISIDPRNHGKSSFSFKGNTYAQQGADIGALIEHLDLKDVVLLGWSFGALACCNYVEQYGTNRLSAFVTIDNPPCPISEDPSEYRAGDLNMLRSFHFESFASDKGFFDFVDKNFVDGIFFINPPQEEAGRNAVINTSLHLPLFVGDALILDGHLSDKRIIMKKICETVPNLFFVADYRKEAGLRCLKRDYPDAEVVALGNHMVFFEYPVEFNKVLETFLDKNKL